MKLGPLALGLKRLKMFKAVLLAVSYLRVKPVHLSQNSTYSMTGIFGRVGLVVECSAIFR